MRERVDHEKRVSVRKYEKAHQHTIKNYDFQPGRLVLIRHTKVEKSLDSKMEPRYFGPMVVIRRTKGGSYLVAEMNGAMYHGKVAAFRVIPYEARYSIRLPENIHKLIDISSETLETMVDDDSAEESQQQRPGAKKSKKRKGKDLLFDKVRLRVSPEDAEDEETSESEAEEVELDETDSEEENEGPRRSKRTKKP
ncbi:hypothetical protein B0H19DRAFT_947857 [Mycena capillaripes]|nr:hypothetical protein B0H19DRAFT_947857 [Mycena capillaripes]